MLACCQVVVLSSSGRTAASAQTAAEAELAQSACSAARQAERTKAAAEPV